MSAAFEWRPAAADILVALEFIDPTLELVLRGQARAHAPAFQDQDRDGRADLMPVGERSPVVYRFVDARHRRDAGLAQQAIERSARQVEIVRARNATGFQQRMHLAAESRPLDTRQVEIVDRPHSRRGAAALQPRRHGRLAAPLRAAEPGDDGPAEPVVTATIASATSASPASKRPALCVKLRCRSIVIRMRPQPPCHRGRASDGPAPPKRARLRARGRTRCSVAPLPCSLNLQVQPGKSELFVPPDS